MNINEHDKKEIKGCTLLKDKVIIEEQDKEITRLNNRINELDKLIEQYSRNDYYYKYNGKYLKSEIIEDLKELKEKKDE